MPLQQSTIGCRSLQASRLSLLPNLKITVTVYRNFWELQAVSIHSKDVHLQPFPLPLSFFLLLHEASTHSRLSFLNDKLH